MVSILVLLDDPHQEIFAQIFMRLCRVSILVLLDDPHQGCNDAGDVTDVMVSILVLLDDPHQVHSARGISGLFACFNPCSSG